MKLAALPWKTAASPKAKAPSRPVERAHWNTPIPQDLKRQLRHLAGKALRVSWMEGLLWLVAAVCLLALGQMVLDWMLDFSRTIRALLLVGDAVIIAGIIWWFGIRPWLRRLGPEQAALRAEKRFPNLKTAVISAVQLSRTADGSPTLVEALMQQVAKRVHGLNFSDAIETRHLKRPMMIAVASALLLVAGVAITLPKSWILVQRLALADLPLPTETVVEPVSENMDVPPGTTVELAARAVGVVPKSGRVEIEYPGKPPLVLSLSPAPAEAALFAVSLQNVQQPFKYRIYLNDGRTPEFSVRIVRGPVLETITFEQHYPAYTGLAPTQHSAGNLTLLAGSKLHIAAKADQPLVSAVLQPQGGVPELPLTLGGDKKAVTGELPVPTEGLQGFTLALTNEEGAPSQNNTVYHVQVTPDAIPEIAFAEDQPEQQTLVVTSRPRLRFSARDDFALRTVTFCARSEEDPEKVTRVPLKLERTGSSATFDYTVADPAASLPWKEGTTIAYWVEAEDNNDVTGPGIGRSTERFWTIVSLQAKQQELMEKLSRSAEIMQDLSKTQEELRKSVSEIAAPPPAAAD